MSLQLIRFFFCCLFTALLGACSPPPEVKTEKPHDSRRDFLDVPASPFVSVHRNKFYLQGKPYRFVGANVWYAAYLGSASDDIGDRARLLRELDLLQSYGVTNLRLLAASERSPLDNSLSPAISYQGEVEREDILVGLDFVLAEMAKRNMKAVLYLNNFWEWSGGMMAYLSWVNGGKFINPGDPQHPWPAFALFAAEFYRNPEAINLYHKYVRQLLERSNTITGQLYKDDPTIMAWQLANEPRPGEGEISQEFMPDYRNWVASSAQLIKQHAPQQLVSLGSEGTMGCLNLEECFLAVHSIPEIDYSTFHLWPKNWGWYDAKQLEATFPETMQKTGEYMALHIRLAEQLNKPLVLEEFGLERDQGKLTPDASVQYRNQYFQYVYSFVARSSHTGGPLVGSNFWGWGGYGRAEHADKLWQVGDKSFLGDPPQEPQGLNSVFSSDSSTLDIFLQHHGVLQAP